MGLWFLYVQGSSAGFMVEAMRFGGFLPCKYLGPFGQ